MQQRDKLYIYGAGGHAKVVAATARLCGYEVAGFWEDSPDRIGEDFFGSKIIDFDAIPYQSSIIIAFGNNAIRLDKGNALRDNFKIKTLIHPSAQVAADAVIEEGCYIGALANIDPGCRIGGFTIINKLVNLSHDTIVGKGAHVTAGSIVAGHCSIGDMAFLGIGSKVIENIHVGRGSIIGAGAVIISDIPDNVTAVGCPARIIKYR